MSKSPQEGGKPRATDANVNAGKNGEIQNILSTMGLNEEEVKMQTMPSKKRHPSCTDVFDKFWFCGNPKSQIDFYYKNGELEDCVSFLKDWGTCLQSKLVLDEDRKEKILDRMKISKSYSNVNTVFEMKKKPSWENE